MENTQINLLCSSGKTVNNRHVADIKDAASYLLYIVTSSMFAHGIDYIVVTPTPTAETFYTQFVEKLKIDLNPPLLKNSFIRQSDGRMVLTNPSLTNMSGGRLHQYYNSGEKVHISGYGKRTIWTNDARTKYFIVLNKKYYPTRIT